MQHGYHLNHKAQDYLDMVTDQFDVVCTVRHPTLRI